MFEREDRDDDDIINTEEVPKRAVNAKVQPSTYQML